MKVRCRKYRSLSLLISYFFFIVLSVASLAQQVKYTDAAASSLSGTDLCYSTSWFSVRNPASLALYRMSSVGINYHNRFLIPELGSHSLFGTLAAVGTWGYAIHYFGTPAYNESSFSVSYGRNIFSWLDAGVSMKGHCGAAEVLPEKSYAITGDIGVIIKPADEIKIGAHLINPSASGFHNNTYNKIPLELITGMAYMPEKNGYAAFQIHWNNCVGWFLSFGSEYRLVDFFVLRAGIKVASELSYSYGVAFDYRNFVLEAGFDQHMHLGLSAAITLVYKIIPPANEK